MLKPYLFSSCARPANAASSLHAHARRDLARSRTIRARIAQAALAFAALGAASSAFAQASEPVQSSVFTHRVTVDDGPQSGAINDNWKFITNPPAKPVAASDPAADSGKHGHGRGSGSGGGRGTRGTSSASNDSAASAPAGTPPMAPPDAAPAPNAGAASQQQ
ncbi:hypothetical protein [Pararobbsia silviterrae]|uniref:Uncharacterized protein n=1 Tax=Pararobbsia silviterrae TaxID=1792498 RepID=A0A494YEC8_9BURK|nr:hypothetical protein [Pararobbsia silviterrae]RKP58713.1 hypothetical protein D7S86_01880 [Pararobbsia silviterrae]